MEIKFRGKRIDNGEFMYGSLVTDPTGRWGRHKAWIFNSDKRLPVNPATVGQFMGLKDKSGQEIYDGDIVDVYFRDEQNYQRGVFKWDTNTMGFRWYENEDGPWTITFKNILEVVGNIHDNGDLLHE